MKAVMTLEERRQSDAKKSVTAKDTLEKKYIRCFKLGSKVYVPTYTPPSLGGIEYVGPESSSENGLDIQKYIYFQSVLYLLKNFYG